MQSVCARRFRCRTSLHNRCFRVRTKSLLRSGPLLNSFGTYLPTFCNSDGVGPITYRAWLVLYGQEEHWRTQRSENTKFGMWEGFVLRTAVFRLF